MMAPAKYAAQGSGPDNSRLFGIAISCLLGLHIAALFICFIVKQHRIKSSKAHTKNECSHNKQRIAFKALDDDVVLNGSERTPAWVEAGMRHNTTSAPPYGHYPKGSDSSPFLESHTLEPIPRCFPPNGARLSQMGSVTPWALPPASPRGWASARFPSTSRDSLSKFTRHKHHDPNIKPDMMDTVAFRGSSRRAVSMTDHMGSGEPNDAVSPPPLIRRTKDSNTFSH